jgi:glycosyltransferase involved in cell wall biosynthesis
MPSFSVIIPLYNKAQYIASAVRSVIEQEFRDFELIVVDDGSTDESVSRLTSAAADPRFRLIRQANAGEGAARNRGMSESRGGLIAFLDADDEWMPTHLSDLDTLATRFQGAGILATRFAHKSGDTVNVDDTIRCDTPQLLTNYFQLATRRAFIVNSSSCAIRRHVLLEVGGFLEATPIGADQEYWARVGLKYALAYHPRLSAVYRLGVPGSAMSSLTWRSDLPVVVVTLKKCLAPLQENAELSISVRNYAAWILLNQVANGIRRGAGRRVRSLLQDPFLKDCRFRRRLITLQVLSLLPAFMSVAIFRLHLSPMASLWRGLYAWVTAPNEEPSADSGLV